MDRKDEGLVRIISDPSRVHNLQPAVEENLDRDELINTLDLVFRKINILGEGKSNALILKDSERFWNFFLNNQKICF